MRAAHLGRNPPKGAHDEHHAHPQEVPHRSRRHSRRHHGGNRPCLILSAGPRRHSIRSQTRRGSRSRQPGWIRRESESWARRSSQRGWARRRERGLGSPVPMCFRRYITESLPVPHMGVGRQSAQGNWTRAGPGIARLACAQQNCFEYENDPCHGECAVTAVPNMEIVGPTDGGACPRRRRTVTDRRSPKSRTATPTGYTISAFGMLRDRDGAADCVTRRVLHRRDPPKRNCGTRQTAPGLYAIARNEALRRTPGTSPRNTNGRIA